ncbi:MAG: PfkB family carbohydrate kinase [Verrucomicrobiota bacterium]
MNSSRFKSLAANYAKLSIAVAGDFCLDRYFDLDPARTEISIETGLPVYNIVNVRTQPGAAGTILNNLVALGIGEIFVVGFAGEDGEGWSLIRALQAKPGVRMDYFLQTTERRTFTYTKPLMFEPGKPPRELNRLDMKNWSPTSPALSRRLGEACEELAGHVDAFILMDQVDLPNTGVLTTEVLDSIRAIARAKPGLLIMADSRRGLRDFPPVTFKMNAAEMARLTGKSPAVSLPEVQQQAVELAATNGQRVFITLAERGILGASPEGQVEHVPALPVRGEIDIVGAGDAVTANLTASLAAGATPRESMEIANAAASIVIHQLGTTGTATVEQIGNLLSTGHNRA